MQGRATPKRVKLTGFLDGVSLTFRAKIVGSQLVGKARIKGPSARASGVLTLTQNAPVADGTSCDAVYDANQTFFDDMVLGDALVACTSCHVAAGQADATRFHVSTDPLTTARAIVPFVDALDPSASRILQKPLGLLPHGGGQQIVPDSTQEQELQQWIDLVAQAHCN